MDSEVPAVTAAEAEPLGNDSSSESSTDSGTDKDTSDGMVFITPAVILVIILFAPITGATQEKPLLSGDQAVLGLMLMILWGIFSTEGSPNSCCRAFYSVVPSLLLCYFVPGLCTTLNVINPGDSNLYVIARDYLLPACLVLLTVSIDLPAIRNLGFKAIIMFFAATLGVMMGGPLAFLVMRGISPSTVSGDSVWRGFASLAGSWIGGGANQLAMKEIFEASDEIFAKVAVVDAIAANLWMAMLLFGARHAERIDSWLHADASAIDDLAVRLSKYVETVKRIPSTNDLMLIAATGFGSTAVAAVCGSYLSVWMVSLSPRLKEFGLGSDFFWLVVICTAIGFALSFTPLRGLEGVGASKVGTVFLYILVTSIGMKMNFTEIVKDPLLILVGIVWIFFIACVTIIVAKLTRAPFFFLAVGSQANIGGAASAPVIAAAFHPALASVGVLLAVLGYAVGTYGALICGYMLKYVHPA
jgi:uncharacterized membrane protein